MAKVLIVGGGFGGVVAAESLAKKLGSDHEITLVSRSRKFLFYPALIRFAFGQCRLEDISYDLREAMLDRRVRFVEGEVVRINLEERRGKSPQKTLRRKFKGVLLQSFMITK